MSMPNKIESDSRKLLGRLRDTMAEEAKGQDRLDKITQLIASTTGTEVCSIYLLRDPETLELCATCLLYTSPSPRDRQKSRMPSSA